MHVKVHAKGITMIFLLTSLFDITMYATKPHATQNSGQKNKSTYKVLI